MAATYPPINPGQRLGAQLRSFIDTLARARDQGVQLIAVMSTLVDDPAKPTDFSALEQQFGLQQGTGAELYALMTALSALNGEPLNAICHRCG